MKTSIEAYTRECGVPLEHASIYDLKHKIIISIDMSIRLSKVIFGPGMALFQQNFPDIDQNAKYNHTRGTVVPVCSIYKIIPMAPHMWVFGSIPIVHI